MAAMKYRRHPNQIGGTAATPIFMTGQLTAQMQIGIARSILFAG
jgi:hypothetical protein